MHIFKISILRNGLYRAFRYGRVRLNGDVCYCHLRHINFEFDV